MQQQPPPPTHSNQTQITSKLMLLLLPDHFYRIPRAFAVKKPIFLYVLKPIIDFLSIVIILNSLDDALGFQPPPPTHRRISPQNLYE